MAKYVRRHFFSESKILIIFAAILMKLTYLCKKDYY